MRNRFLILLVTFFTLTSCDKEDDHQIKNTETSVSNSKQVNCDLKTIISAELYKNDLNNSLSINSIILDENCLKVSYSSSGCDGNTWEIQLIDSGEVLESDPVQRNLKLSLKNDELCLFEITKEVSFDLSNLKGDGDRSVLHIKNWNTPIIYKY